MMSSNVEHGAVGTQTSGDGEAFEWRRAQYEEMGFTRPEAIALAHSTQVGYTGGKDKNSKKLEWRVPLSWSKVKAALDSGKCDHALALHIFLSDEVLDTE